ncbi:peptidyl-prolyl cis-trans isomerase [bacterium]|nr:peptidyl-prolyl cis-trans isomerase [bacterium]
MPKTNDLWSGLVIACLLLGGCGGKKEPVIATVNGARLTLEDLYAEIPPYYLNTITQEQKIQFVERWINGELFYQEALRRGLQRETHIKEKIRAAEKNILIADLIQQELQNRVQVTEQEIGDYYQAHVDDFTRKADQVRAQQILVPTLVEAQKIRRELEAGEDFTRLASQHSVDPSAEQGGDLGFFFREDVIPEVAKVAFSTSPGDLSVPIKTEFGYHLIIVTDIKKAGSVLSLDLVRDEINNQLSAQKELEELNLFLLELKEQSSIDQHMELLRSSLAPAESVFVPQEENL